MHFLSKVCLVALILLQPLTHLHAQKTKPRIASKAPVIFENGIRIIANGFTVSRAFLMFDDQTPVPAGNKVSIGQNINMMVIIDSGWTAIEGKAYPGASETIKLSNGFEVLKENDLFAGYSNTGVAVSDAKYVTLKAKITEMRDQNNYVIVTFRIWDKKGKAEIKGSYRFFIR
jgi:hypothetical protein